MASINEAFAECFTLLHAAPDPAPLIHTLHWPILDAIQHANAAAARAAMLAHFDQLAQVLRDLGVGDEPLVGRGPAASTPAPDSGASRERAYAPAAGRG